jgi:tripartite-type tricarboxylate transporter receptor subunit TctC
LPGQPKKDEAHVLNRRRLIQLLAAAASPLTAGSSRAQDWPTRPLRLIVPFPAGGSADLSGRLLAEGLRQKLGQPVIVENKPGAGGNLAAAETARSQGDGYTVFVGTTGTHVFNQFIYRHPGFDAVKDFAPLGTMWSASNVCVVNPSLPVHSLAELVDYARANPGKLSFGTSGVGVATHLSGELFQKETGTKLVHVPYRGQAPALTDLMSGRIQVMFPIVPDVLAHVQSGAVRALAITTAKRQQILKDVPTVVEAGFPTLVFSTWVGAFVRTGTSAAIVDRLAAAMKAAVDSPEYRKPLTDLGIEVDPIFQADFQRQIAEEQSRWGKLIAEIGIKID